MALQELRTFWMLLLTNFRLLFLMMVFTSYFVAIDGIQEMRYTTAMVPNNSIEYTSGVFQSTEEYRTELAIGDRSSIQDAALQNSSYMSPDNIFRLRGSPETNRVLNTGNQSELHQLFPIVTFDEQKRDISNRFDQSTDTTATDIFQQYSSSNPKTDIEELVSLDLCRQYSSCERVSNLTFKFCQCDALCVIYNDCCYNADIPDNSTVSSDLQFDCISPIMFSWEAAYNGYQVVKTCPKNLKNTEIDIKCQSDDIFLFGPWVITNSNIMFKNRFCAKCNNENVYKPFDVKLSYQKSNVTISKNSNPTIVLAAMKDLYEYSAKNNFVVEFIPPVAKNLRECFLYNDPRNESKICLNNYISPAIVEKNGKKEVVRNTFCIGPDLLFWCVGMFDTFDPSYVINHDTFPMTVLFQFQQGCKGEFDVDGICLGRLYEKQIYLYASLVSSTHFSRIMIEEILTIMAWSFSDEILAITFRYHYSVEKIDNLFHIANVNIFGEMINKQSYEQSLKIENQIGEAQWLIRVFPQNGLAFEVNVVGAAMPQSLGTELSKATVQNKLNQFKANFNDSFEKKLCAKSIIECEIKSDTGNPRTVIKEFTCVDFIQEQPIFASTNINMNVITYTGMGISVIALTASIFVYRRLGMHRSIPGSNVENLSIALLISDIIFMLGIGANDLSLVCYSVGVALHYLWLLVFSFKCIALIHMCHSLTKLSLIAGDIEVGMFSKKPFFTLLGLLLPCLFVVPAVLIDFLEVQGVSIDYSGSICFPTGYPGNLIFVSTPIGLAVVINITCLLCIAVVITKQSLGIRHIRRSNSFQYLPVFVRISLVTGMLWITGLLGAIIKNEVMDYLFVIFCSFQGLLIAFGNLTTKRLYREVRKRKQSLSK